MFFLGFFHTKLPFKLYYLALDESIKEKQKKIWISRFNVLLFSACLQVMLNNCTLLLKSDLFGCRIRVKNLNENTDLSALSREIIDKCKLISPNKLPEIEQLLYYLQNRKESSPPKGK